MRKTFSAFALSAAVGAAVLAAPTAQAANPYIQFSGANQRLTATAKNLPKHTECTFYRNMTPQNSSAGSSGSSGSSGGNLVAIGRKVAYSGEAKIMSRKQRSGSYPVRMRCLSPAGPGGVQNIIVQRDGSIRVTPAPKPQPKPQGQNQNQNKPENKPQNQAG